ncbi:MAG: HAD family hydrolase [Deltaproteobacteria bacterium]|nr:HAD family hydrolase [Deltaproteobacteria bacterium]
MSIKAVILDFDGVILESNTIKVLAYYDLFEDYPEYRAAMIVYHNKNIAQTRVEKFRYFVQELMNEENDDAFNVMMKRFSCYVVERLKTCSYVPGAEMFIKEFSLLVPLYLSSLMPQEELHETIKVLGIEHCFSGIYGNPPYTKENAIEHILAERHLSPEETLLVGDSMSDYLATLKTGIEFIGRDRSGSLKELKLPVYKDLYGIAESLRPKLAT